MQSLAHAPFHLDAGAMAWVRSTFDSLSTDGKVAQLFVLLSRSTSPDELAALSRLQPGGITKGFGPDGHAEIAFIDAFAKASRVPPLISSDLEGSRMSVPFGTQVLNPLGLSAIDDLEATSAVAQLMAEEARALGVTWSFTPVIDINHAFRSAIVGTRSFGSDVERIERHALAQIAAFQAGGIAATVKHWPGEGYDDRDQHLVTTHNPLGLEEWEATFGRLYRAAIAQGVMAIMSGHIAFPAFMRSLDPDCGLDAFKPASINRALNITLLREKLGFNGLIVSDATPMAGLGSWCATADYMPALIANGCDVILFSNAPEQDMANVRAAVASGAISSARLDEAVTRILGLKAATGLHKAPVIDLATASQRAFRTPETTAMADAVTARAPTLVKDVQKLLPLDPARHKRVLIITSGIVSPFTPEPLPFELPAMLTAEGFEVAMHTKGMAVTRERFDLVLYLLGDESLLTRSHIFIDWVKMTGDLHGAMNRTWHEIPTAMIAFGHPYSLYDAPRVPIYVNAYSTLPSVQCAVLECLLGRAPWNTKSPVDPFCGLEDARY